MRLTDVDAITDDYFRNVKNHILAYNPAPISIPYCFIIYPDKYKIRKKINKYLRILKNIYFFDRYNYSEIKRKTIIEFYEKQLRQCWKLRKYYKFTN